MSILDSLGGLLDTGSDWLGDVFGDIGDGDYNDLIALIGGGAAASGLFDSEQEKVGYQGKIPEYTAVREQVPIDWDSDRKPGERGQRYFSDTTYAQKPETPVPTVAQAEQITWEQILDLIAQNYTGNGNTGTVEPPAPTPAPAPPPAPAPTPAPAPYESPLSLGGIGGLSATGVANPGYSFAADTYNPVTGKYEKQDVQWVGEGDPSANTQAQFLDFLQGSPIGSNQINFSAPAPAPYISPLSLGGLGSVYGGQSYAADTYNYDTGKYERAGSFAEGGIVDAMDALRGGGKPPMPQQQMPQQQMPQQQMPQPPMPQQPQGISQAGRYLNGQTDGMGDQVNINAADGEFVVPADAVSHLGNGNSDAGAAQLTAMMDRIRKARTGSPEQGKRINPNNFIPA